MHRSLSVVLALAIGVGLLGSPWPTRTAAAEPDGFAYGVIVDTTDARSSRLAREAGFTHSKMMLQWANVEPSRGNFVWNSTKENDYDNIMKPTRNEGLALVVRVDGVPGWAGGSPAQADLGAVREFYEEAARYGAGTVVAFEILNEPNLDREWGGAPSAAGYTAFLKAAYQGIKAGNPDALVLGGGPAPGTGNNPGATIEDVDFINGMYDAGAANAMDALAVHNYGGNTEPERDPTTCTICFRRAEVYHDLMVRRGDGGKPIWLTEWGYLMDAGQNMGQYDWMKVSADQQADFLVRAHRYAIENWPWLGGSLLYNIDGATSPYQNYGGFDAKAWFSILNADYSPRPAFGALQSLRDGPLAAKLGPRGSAAPAAQAEPTEDASVVEATDGALAASSGGDGGRVRVVGTDGQGLSLRATPGLTAARIKTVREGSILVTLGGSQQANGLTWLNVSEPAGASGWVAAQYVEKI